MEFSVKNVEKITRIDDLTEKDAKTIWNYWKKNKFIIPENLNNPEEYEALGDIHIEKSFEDMINWQFEDYTPFDMLGVSDKIEDHKDYLYLEDEDNVMFFYSMA